ncbi:hypothetical protein CDO52_09085 [Nocardiopsis gilva YIM 90087]|uniref:DUF4350 domain-containing protein n=1 Tax=Nocardiopsis gilva YIM 90087 TaxID=1235441 RepID=A0A223S466_9ACTN|nr:hypothetical protein [Nocardiopsis gilva]ASU82922.1 hypothetical protein CDO52_09085 [Nocardiopsis gilva YIM 90087]
MPGIPAILRPAAATGVLALSAFVGAAAPATADTCVPPTADGSVPELSHEELLAALDCPGDLSDTLAEATRGPDPVYVHPYLTALYPDLTPEQVGASFDGQFQIAVIPSDVASAPELAERMRQQLSDHGLALVFEWRGNHRFSLGIAAGAARSHSWQSRRHVVNDEVEVGQITPTLKTLALPFEKALDTAGKQLRHQHVYFGHASEETWPHTPDYFVHANESLTDLEAPVRVAFLPEAAVTYVTRDTPGKALGDAAAMVRAAGKIDEPVVVYLVNARGEVTGASTSGAIPTLIPGTGEAELAQRAVFAADHNPYSTLQSLVARLGGPSDMRGSQPVTTPAKQWKVFGGIAAGLLALLVGYSFLLRRVRPRGRPAVARQDAAALNTRRAAAQAAVTSLGELIAATPVPDTAEENHELRAILADYPKLRESVDHAATTEQIADALAAVAEAQSAVTRLATGRP